METNPKAAAAPEIEYQRQDFLEILSLDPRQADDVTNNIEVRDDGVWLKEVGYEELDWSPACDLDGPSGPNPLTTPALPFPFNARWLAAWMLDGRGWWVRVRFGEWSDGPDSRVLDAMGVRAVKPREALIAAYEAYREARAIVGRDDVNIDVPEAQAQYDAAKAKAKSKSAQKAAFTRLTEARRVAAATHRTWRKEMVLRLLGSAPGRRDYEDSLGSGESAEERQARRYQMCVDSGLKMPSTDYARLPPGIGKLAAMEKVSRPAFSKDIKKYIARQTTK